MRIRISHNFIFAFFILSLLSCELTENQPDQEIDDACLCESDCGEIPYKTVSEFAISVKGIPYDYNASYVYEDESVRQFWGFDKNRNTLYVFDLDSETLQDSIVIPREGPGSISLIYGFLVHSQDSIFIHTNERKHLYLIDSAGNILKDWHFTDLLPSGRENEMFYAVSMPNRNVRMHFEPKTSEMYFSMVNYDMKSEDPYPKELFDLPFILSYSLEKNSYTRLFGDFPPTYRQEDKSSYEALFPFAKAGDNIYASFLKSHCLYKYDQNMNLTPVCIRSRYLDEKFKFLPFGADSKQTRELYDLQGNYVSLLHDPYRKLLYRVVSHSQPKYDKDDLLVEKIQAPWSIMVLDEAGNCLGEKKFPASVYDFEKIYVTKKGLLISKENPFYELNEEDILNFELIIFDHEN